MAWTRQRKADTSWRRPPRPIGSTIRFSRSAATSPVFALCVAVFICGTGTQALSSPVSRTYDAKTMRCCWSRLRWRPESNCKRRAANFSPECWPVLLRALCFACWAKPVSWRRRKTMRFLPPFGNSMICCFIARPVSDRAAQWARPGDSGIAWNHPPR